MPFTYSQPPNRFGAAVCGNPVLPPMLFLHGQLHAPASFTREAAAFTASYLTGSPARHYLKDHPIRNLGHCATGA